MINSHIALYCFYAVESILVKSKLQFRLVEKIYFNLRKLNLVPRPFFRVKHFA
ncbi:protein of unknown function [Xenorhabdus bovienii]|uniref:Uncharacterized protein n=1 Tax=Xenorhabdus bovienii TaxID=40576 RepID=A0A0B6X7T9_XENBV|nr:protein of unknown function [Xenorhabdus bovienii]